MFDHMKIGRFTLRIRALDDINLPAYKGSTLRGGFGKALKQVCCALKREHCDTCLLRNQCVYVYLFETTPPEDSEMMRLYPTVPQPFVIEPPEGNEGTVKAGDSLGFGLVLVGRALDFIPYFIYAFIRFGELGIGRGRGKFTLEEVLPVGASESIYKPESDSLRAVQPYPYEAIRSRSEELRSFSELNLRFCTPTRIKSNGHFIEEPEFHQLFRSLLRRLSSLSYFHCAKRLEFDFRSLIERAEAIERTDSNLHWYDWERYSARQKQRMSLGGFLGEASFRGSFGGLLPFLALGEVVHVGKAASFGLGRFEIRGN